MMVVGQRSQGQVTRVTNLCNEDQEIWVTAIESTLTRFGPLEIRLAGIFTHARFEIR